MRVLKRNQLIILVISLMLITAGYLNFTSNQSNIQTSIISQRDDDTLGDAQFVSTIPKEENIIENQISEENDKQIENQENELVETTANKNNTIETSTEDYYFTTSKLERNTMYSELLETYQEMYNNTNSTTEQKAEAFKRINDINNTKNAIMISENLIIAKGFDDVVIFENETSISVIIKSKELKQEEVAQVQNIISREMNVSAEIIHISNK